MFQTLSRKERDEVAQEQQRATETALSTLAVQFQEHVDRTFGPLLSQCKEEGAARVAIMEHPCSLNGQEAQLVPINVVKMRVYVCLCACACVCVCVMCMCVHVHLCVCVCVCVCVCACACVCACQ